MCGAGTDRGGGVSGFPGDFAGRVVLRDSSTWDALKLAFSGH